MAATATTLTPAARQAAIKQPHGRLRHRPDKSVPRSTASSSAPSSADTDACLPGFGGYNEDQLRYTYRDFSGADLRITNKSFDNNTLTAYRRFYSENTTSPLAPLSPTPTAANPQASNFYQEPGLGSGPQIGRQLSTFGIYDRWHPLGDDWGEFASKLSIVSGWEYTA